MSKRQTMKMDSRQGQGNSTARKERGFSTLLGISLQDNRRRDTVYYHIDLNAGCGVNEKADCDGSPLVFLRQATAIRRAGAVHARFCDHDEGHVAALRRQIAACRFLPPAPSTVEVLCQDNSLFLDLVTQEIEHTAKNPRRVTGTCLCDPNGFKGFPVNALTAFAVRFPRIDVILNLNCSLFRTVEGCKKPDARLRPATIQTFRTWPTPQQIIDRMARRHWFIRNPMTSGRGHDFTILYGRNSPLRKCNEFDYFYPLGSPTGGRILDRLKRVAVGQLEIPFPPPGEILP